MERGKIIVIAAPSGCGKSTIIRALMERRGLDIHFAVSATTRPPRPGEINGESYYFITEDDFRRGIEADEFVEYEEVYAGRFYGTPRAEIDRITGAGHNILLDIDVNGAMRVKEIYRTEALTVFIKPPSVAELRRRLEARGTETPESIDARVARAEYEISRGAEFDVRVMNDSLDEAVERTYNIIKRFIQC